MCWVLLMVVVLSLCAIKFANASPTITNKGDGNGDPILDAGANYSMECVGNQPLKWSYPEASEHFKTHWTNFTVITEEPVDGVYHSVLQITNMSYPFVGYYRCRYEDGEDLDSIYLYINDIEHLSVEDNYQLHYAVQNEETTIPCRPTSPEIQVTLINDGDDIIYSDYNPKTGFTFMARPKMQGMYFCNFNNLQSHKSVELTLFLEIRSAREYLAIPYIEDESRNHTDEGDTLQLTCYLQETSSHIGFRWTTPRGQFKNRAGSILPEDVTIKASQSVQKPEGKYLVSQLQIRNVKVEDSGFYYCDVFDKQNHSENFRIGITIHSRNDCCVEIMEENDQNVLNVKAGEQAQWILDVKAHPYPKLIWYDNTGQEVKNNSMYYTEYNGVKATFRIHNAQLGNTGTYKLRAVASREYEAEHCPKSDEFDLILNVTAKPTVCLSAGYGRCKTNENPSPEIFLLGSEAEIGCVATGNPEPEIAWEGNCTLPDRGCEFYHQDCSVKARKKLFTNVSCYKFTATTDGVVKCVAINGLGTSELTVPYHISDVSNGFDVFDFPSGAIVKVDGSRTDVIIAENETFSFTCGVSPKKSEQLEVFFNDDYLNERHEQTAQKSNDLSKKIEVTLTYPQLDDAGMYSCRIKNLHDQTYEYRNVSLTVKASKEPQIRESNLESEVVVDYPEMMAILTCYVEGIPKPTIQWFKDGTPIVASERITLEQEGQTLTLNSTLVTDEGIYRCEATNSAGMAFTQNALRIAMKPTPASVYWYVGIAIGVLLLCLLGSMAYIYKKIRDEREMRKILKKMGLENFHKGSPENLNPDLGVDEQAELLPYDHKFEIPIDHLKIGKQLGSGAFGVVMKAEARGIIPGEPKTIVAVKMVKKNADESYIKALASELKIMVHLGKHINVVNLLGACTKNVTKRELLVIVEYCRFGNLQNYIYKHRGNYINQVDHVTGNIDYHIGAALLNRSYSVTSDACVSPDHTLRSISMQYHRDREHTMSTQLSYTGDDTVMLSNNSSQPEWRLNYAGDYKGEVKPISTRDLLAWSFQVARGMEYLALRKVLHGDLAARNILLADNNVVKICDFGLAKTMYKDDNYKKKGNSPLPIKWMAIESIRDRVFSTQSDVWSFGIVLWEFFSLSRSPYPGMEPNEQLYQKLIAGYRMESPEYAPREIYNTMLKCWNATPLHRPSFSVLAEKIGSLLEENVKRYYIELNDPYFKMNTEKREQDYLSMLSPPTFEALSTPPVHYSNAEMQYPPSGSVPVGYMDMRPNQIFSPRIQPDEVFNFHTGGQDDVYQENGYLEPITPINSVSNPLYNQIPSVKLKMGPKLLDTPDNYISMPEYKNLRNSNSKDSGISSPVEIMDLEADTPKSYYVNSSDGV